MIAVLAELSYWQATIIRVAAGLVAVLLVAGTLVYAHLFKMVSFMQSRLGPMEAGPYGSLQLMAEIGKFLQKEDIVPARADRFVFKAAPFVVLTSTFLLLVVLPGGPGRLVHLQRPGDLPGHGRQRSVSVIGILIGRLGLGVEVLPPRVGCGPPASSSPTSCPCCWPWSAWSSRPRP